MRVVIPAFRAGESLPACVAALHASTRRDDLQIIIVDDGQNVCLERLLENFPDIRVVDQGPSGHPGIARNRGAEGIDPDDIIVFVDADVELENDAIEHLVAPIESGEADATFGCLSTNVEGMSFAQMYKQLYLSHIYSRYSGRLENYFWTAISAVKASTFAELGGFKRCAPGTLNEDTELGISLTRAGRRVVAVPEARGRHLKPYTLRGLVQNDFAKGCSSVSLFLGRSGVKLSDNLHASKSDMRAVFMAGVVLISSPVVARVRQINGVSGIFG